MNAEATVLRYCHHYYQKDRRNCERYFHYDTRVTEQSSRGYSFSGTVHYVAHDRQRIRLARAIRLVTQFNLHPLLKLGHSLFAMLSIWSPLHRVPRPLSQSSICQ